MPQNQIMATPDLQTNNPAAPQENYGKILMSWRAPEYEKQGKSRNWYVATFSIGAFLVGSSIWMKNYLLIIVVVMFGIVLYILNKKEPLTLDIALTEKGVKMGEKFYPYNTLQEFWIIYDPPVKTLNFKNNRTFFPEISMQIMDQNPVNIREILLPFLDENPEKTEESTTDRLSRLLKI